jgi:gliding motility-associated-like protein
MNPNQYLWVSQLYTMAKAWHFYLFVLLLMSSLFCRAQDILWVRQSEDVAFLEGVWSGKMEQDHAGNIIGLYRLMGRTKIEGDLLQSNGVDDMLLIKYDPDGHVIWKHVIGGPDWDMGSDLAVDSQNNIVLTATMPQGGDFLGTILDKINGTALAAKISPAGSLVWVKQLGNTNAQGQSITVDAGDNVIVGARVATYQLQLTKYTAEGSLVWHQSMTQSGCCVSPAIIDLKTDINNNVYMIGDFLTNINFSGNSVSAYLFGVFIYKLDAQGNFEWSNKAVAETGETNQVRSWGLDLDAMNNVYITGYFERLAKFGGITLQEKNPIDDRTTYLAKLNTAGQFMWAKAMYGRDVLPGKIRINLLANEVSVCVSSNSWFNYSDEYISSLTSNQSMILTTDLDGKFVKAFFINTEAFPSYPADIVFSGANEFYVMGAFYGDFTLGCFELDGGSQFTSFLFKSGKIPDIVVNDADGYCRNDILRIMAQGSGIQHATKFKWIFPPGVTSISGLYETVDNFIDIVLAEDFQPAPYTIIPYYECYPRTEYSGLFGEEIALPDQPPLPTGDSVICVGVNARYTIPSMNNVNGYEWASGTALEKLPGDGNILDVTTAIKNQVEYLKVRGVNQCGAGEYSDSLRVRLHPVPGKPSVEGATRFCSGQLPIKLTAHPSQNTNSVGWRFSSSPQFASVSPDSTVVNVRFITNQSVAQVWALSKGWCEISLSDPFSIQLIPNLPIPSAIQGSDTVCLNTPGLTYSVAPIAQDVVYHWNLPVGFSALPDPDNAVVLAVGSGAKSGTLQIYISNPCFTSPVRELQIVVETLPDKPKVELDKCERWIKYTGDDEFAWYKDELRLVDESFMLKLSDSGVYKIEVTNFCGSNTSDELMLVPFLQESLFMPNVITPNQDNKNTYFVVDKTLKHSALEIFNRWGKTVFQTTDYKNDWDGGDLAPGIYYYTIRNTCLPNAIVGSIHLIR